MHKIQQENLAKTEKVKKHKKTFALNVDKYIILLTPQFLYAKIKIYAKIKGKIKLRKCRFLFTSRV
jgi:hypothetical protein